MTEKVAELLNQRWATVSPESLEHDYIIPLLYASAGLALNVSRADKEHQAMFREHCRVELDSIIETLTAVRELINQP